MKWLILLLFIRISIPLSEWTGMTDEAKLSLIVSKPSEDCLGTEIKFSFDEKNINLIISCIKWEV